MKKGTQSNVALRIGKQFLMLSGVLGIFGMVQHIAPGADKDVSRTGTKNSALAQSCPVVMSAERISADETEQERTVRFISCAGFLE